MERIGTVRESPLILGMAAGFALLGWSVAAYLGFRKTAISDSSAPVSSLPRTMPDRPAARGGESSRSLMESPAAEKRPVLFLGGTPYPHDVPGSASGSGPDEPPVEALSEEISPGSADYKQLRALTTEALDAYSSFKARVLSGRLDGLINSLLDNGQPISPAKAKRLAAELDKDIRRTKEVFERLDRGPKIRPGHFKVTMRDQREFSTRAADGAKEQAGTGETVTVTFHLVGSEPVTNAFTFLSEQVGRNPTISDKRTLIVSMRKENGKWYWLPFGW